MAIVSLVLVGLGVALIIVGAAISVADWNQRRRQQQEKVTKGVITEATGLDETLKGLAKLADALKGYPLGMQMIVWGIVVLVIAGIFGGVAQLH
jgi:hypothetical protein